MKEMRKSNDKGMLHNATSSATRTPVERLRQLRREALAYRKELRLIVAAVYEVALELMQNEKLWGRFCKDDFWATSPYGKPKVGDRATILPSALRITFGKGRDKDSRLSRYKKRLETFLNEEDDPELVRKELLKNGVLRPQLQLTKTNFDDLVYLEPQLLGMMRSTLSGRCRSC
jgi:hypothetical protein